MLRAAQVIVEEGIARPILIGRPGVVEARLKRFGLSIEPGRDFELINPEDDPRYRDYVATYVEVGGPQGRHARRRQDAGAHQHDGDRRARRAARRGGRADLRPRRAVSSRACKHISDIIGLAPGVARDRGAVAS